MITLSCRQCHYATSSCTQGSSLQYNNDTYYDAFTLMNTSEENNFDSSHVEDSEEDGNDISKIEDVVVRMDLTDDLLHMVCSRGRIIFVFFVFPSMKLICF